MLFSGGGGSPDATRRTSTGQSCEQLITALRHFLEDRLPKSQRPPTPAQQHGCGAAARGGGDDAPAAEKAVKKCASKTVVKQYAPGSWSPFPNNAPPPARGPAPPANPAAWLTARSAPLPAAPPPPLAPRPPPLPAIPTLSVAPPPPRATPTSPPVAAVAAPPPAAVAVDAGAEEGGPGGYQYSATLDVEDAAFVLSVSLPAGVTASDVVLDVLEHGEVRLSAPRPLGDRSMELPGPVRPALRRGAREVQAKEETAP